MVDIYHTERNIVILSKQGNKSSITSSLSGIILENMSLFAWSLVSKHFNCKYDDNFIVRKGSSFGINCIKKDYTMSKHTDIQIYDGHTLIHGEECKTRCDNTWMGSLTEISYSIRNFSMFCPSFSMLALYKDSNITNTDYYCNCDLIDNIFILSGKATRGAWEFPILESKLEMYFDYIFRIITNHKETLKNHES